MCGCPLDPISAKIPQVCPRSPPPQLLPEGRFLGWSLRTPEKPPPASGGPRRLPHLPALGAQAGGAGAGVRRSLHWLRPPLGGGLPSGWRRLGPARAGSPSAPLLELEGELHTGQNARLAGVREGGQRRPACPASGTPFPHPLALAARLLLFQPETTGPRATLNLRRPCTSRTDLSQWGGPLFPKPAP